jgi:hypothetical protein
MLEAQKVYHEDLVLSRSVRMQERTKRTEKKREKPKPPQSETQKLHGESTLYTGA